MMKEFRQCRVIPTPCSRDRPFSISISSSGKSIPASTDAVSEITLSRSAAISEDKPPSSISFAARWLSGLGVDDVHHRFSLGKVDPAVQKARSELTRLRLPAPGGNEQPHGAQRHHAAMTVYLDNVPTVYMSRARITLTSASSRPHPNPITT
jgi:hypothetical protein